MLEKPKCPRCRKVGADLTLVGRQEGDGARQANGALASTLYAYQCQCGATFTHRLWDERAVNSLR